MIFIGISNNVETKKRQTLFFLFIGDGLEHYCTTKYKQTDNEAKF